MIDTMTQLGRKLAEFLDHPGEIVRKNARAIQGYLINNGKDDDVTLGELLESESEGVRRNAMSIYKQLLKHRDGSGELKN